MDNTLHYVYFHVSPLSGKVMYVGTGSHERAWVSRDCHRHNADHVKWMQELEEKGYTPDAWVVIKSSSFDRQKILELEREYIETLAPKFNYTNNWSWCMSLTEDQVVLAKQLRSDGLSYKAIAKEIESSTMTVYRLLTGQTKGYNEHGSQVSKDALLASDLQISLFPMEPGTGSERDVARDSGPIHTKSRFSESNLNPNFYRQGGFD
jgi:hypothetical protein